VLQLQAEEPFGATLLRTEHELRKASGLVPHLACCPTCCGGLTCDCITVCSRCLLCRSSAKSCLVSEARAAPASPRRSVSSPTRTSEQLLLLVLVLLGKLVSQLA
jgi:hypothetical protein